MEKRRMGWIRWLAALLVLVVVGVVVYEWMIRRAPVERAYVPTSFEDLYKTSDVVVVGSAVTSMRTAPVGDEMMSLIGVDVTKCLKGPYELGDRILVLQYNHWQDPHIVEGENAFLFLKPYDLEGQSMYLINGLFDGHYKLQGDSVFPSLILNPDMEAELKAHNFSLAQIEEALGVASSRPTGSHAPVATPEGGPEDTPEGEPTPTPEGLAGNADTPEGTEGETAGTPSASPEASGVGAETTPGAGSPEPDAATPDGTGTPTGTGSPTDAGTIAPTSTP